jgi:hypothetical protein
MGQNERSVFAGARVVIVDDNTERGEVLAAIATDEGYHARTMGLLDALDASADVFVVDASTITSTPGVSARWSMRSFSALADRHPGAKFVVISGMPAGFVSSLVEDLRSQCGVDVAYGGWGDFEQIRAALVGENLIRF